jgi:RNA-binding protein YlmH
MISLEQLEPAKIRLDEMSFTVASLRLDAVASDVYRISRTKMLTPIKSGHCRVNWKVETDPGTRLQNGDIISTQGLGRFMILEADDMTKKGRIRVKAGKFA